MNRSSPEPDKDHLTSQVTGLPRTRHKGFRRFVVHRRQGRDVGDESVQKRRIQGVGVIINDRLFSQYNALFHEKSE